MADRVWDADPHLSAEAERLRREHDEAPCPNGRGDHPTPPKAGSTLIKSGEIGMLEKVDWVWPNWLAAGKFHLLCGQKGTGKSTIAFDLFAQITVGGKFPDGTPAPLGDVLVWSGEDDLNDTILPRVYAAGGDLTHVHYPDCTIVGGVKRSFDPAFDIPSLLEAARKIPTLRALLIDPVVSASSADSHKNSETRRGLQPLIDMTEELHLVLLGITHFTKGTQGQEPIERIAGSLAFGAIPRVVLGAVKGETEEAPRKLVRIASNIGKSGGAFEYLLRQDLLPGFDFTGQRVLWGKQLTGTPLELLGDGQAASQKLSAVKFLDEMLVGGVPVKVKDLKDAAVAHGLSWRTIERAKTEIGTIVAEQAERAWHWRKTSAA